MILAELFPSYVFMLNADGKPVILVPQLCLDDYQLRYADVFGGLSNEFESGTTDAARKVNSNERGGGVGDVGELPPFGSESLDDHRHQNRDFPPEVIERRNLGGFSETFPPEERKNNGNGLEGDVRTTSSFGSMEFDADDFTVLSIATLDPPPQSSENELQDITATGSVSTMTSTGSVKMSAPPNARSFSPVAPTGTPPSRTAATALPKVASSSAASFSLDDGETEFLPEELDADVRDMLVGKRRAGHSFFGTTTLSTTVPTLPTTTTPKICQDKHKVCNYHFSRISCFFEE